MQSTIARKLRQIPEGALLVGVDPHKKRHAVVIMTQQAEVLAKFKVLVSRAGFMLAEQRVAEKVAARGAPGAVWGIEAGGHYWRTLAYALDGWGQTFRLINPFTLKRHREGQDLDRRKNDYRDAEMAAELLRTGKFTETQLVHGRYAELRTAHQGYQRARKAATRLKNQLQALLDGLFPEFRQVFKDVEGKTALAALEAGVAPQELAAGTPEAWLRRVGESAPGQRLVKKKLLSLQARAHLSVGVTAGAGEVSRELGFLVRRLRQIQGEMAAWVGRLEHLVAQVPEYAS